ncbi:hypothetical protein CYMTET_53841 [Cymbomonas tetramitiformis]|uniref:Uncharacterized protein n=1 Tax=Cymbomonas tetramitiformis TaxID=36881 RepID=A0AAE0BHY2_9CHLO|nr:hypothetical protein CYMTET_53841 [Cymbomonas tetramitiformis]
MVAALHEAFVAEDPLLSSLFALDDATVTIRAEGNRLLFSTLELLVHRTSPASDWLEGSAQAFPQDGKRVLLEFARKLPEADAPFRGTADLLYVTLESGVDPGSKIMDFNAALVAARRKNTLDDDDVKGHSSSTPSTPTSIAWSPPARCSKTIGRAWTCSLFNSGSANATRPTCGRARCGQSSSTSARPLRVSATRLARTPLTPTSRTSPGAAQGDYSAVPALIMRGGEGTALAPRLPARAGRVQRRRVRVRTRLRYLASRYATAFQHAIDTNDSDRFDALCFLAGGKPEIIEDFSAASFCVGDTVEEAAIDDGTASARDLHRSAVGGVRRQDVSCGPLQPYEPETSFMDKVATMGGFTLSAPDPDPPLALHRMGSAVSVGAGTGDESDDDDGVLPSPQPAIGCGRPPIGFGRSALTSLLVCTLFILGATAVPLTAATLGGVDVGAAAAPPIGDATCAYPGVFLAATSTSRTPSIDNRGLCSGSFSPTHDFSTTPQLITGTEVGGVRLRSGAASSVYEDGCIFISLTPWISSIDFINIGSSSFSSTHE